MPVQQRDIFFLAHNFFLTLKHYSNNCNHVIAQSFNLLRPTSFYLITQPLQKEKLTIAWKYAAEGKLGECFSKVLLRHP